MEDKARLMRQARYGEAVLCAALLLAVVGCGKVKPGAYQIALDRYYRTMLGGSSEEKLSAAIAGTTEDLKKRPSDAGLLMLRTSARLDLLRATVEARHAWDSERVRAFVEDLRLLQSLVAKPGAQPFWLLPRVQTMWGDAILLSTQAAQEGSTGASGADEARRARENLREQIVAMQLFRLAADAYLRAGSTAAQWIAAAKTSKEPDPQAPAMAQELEYARDGYVTALTGMAQSEMFLRLTPEARQHLVEASALGSGGLFPPLGAIPSGPSSLFSAAHDVASKRAAALESLTVDDFGARAQLAQSSLREEIAARLLSNPVQPVSGNALGQVAGRVAAYLAGITLQVQDLKIAGGGGVAAESISFRLAPHPLYGFAGVRPDVPSLTLQVGAEKVPIRLAPANVASFTLTAPEGTAILIRSAAGTNDLSRDKGGTYFLGRGTPLLTRDKGVTLLGPAGNLLAQTEVP